MSRPGTGNFAQVATGKLSEITYNPETQIYAVKIEDGNSYSLYTAEGSPNWYRIYPGTPDWGRSIENVGGSQGFSYTALASYTSPDHHQNQLAFGFPTPEQGMPKSGKGTFTGVISGEGTMPAPSGWGDVPYAPITGSINFNVDFTVGSLTGLLAPRVNCDCDGPRFEDYAFTGLLTGNGFAGTFDLDPDPHNFINGVFTGPAGQEAMGLWSFPFVMGEGESSQYHWVNGAFVAKNGNGS
jgi:hypothetical protein